MQLVHALVAIDLLFGVTLMFFPLFVCVCGGVTLMLVSVHACAYMSNVVATCRFHHFLALKTTYALKYVHI